MSNGLLGIGRSGLMATKKSLETTGHNISNANTEGYSRQRVEQEATTPVRRGNVVLGKGVDVKNVKRIHDELLEKRLNKANSEHSYHAERSHHLGQLEQIFNEIDGEGLNKLMNNFFNSFRELANQPENDTLREIVRDKAQLMVKDFHRVDDRITLVKRTMESRIERTVVDINAITQQVADLNKQISHLEANDGAMANDLRDQRDLAVKQLAEYMEINTYADEKNQFVVNVVGVGSLVVGGSNIELETGISKETTNPEDPGEMYIFFKGRPNTRLNERFSEGKLQGIVETRNNELLNLKNDLDELAFQTSQAVNAIHRRGYINKPLATDATGQVLVDNTGKAIHDNNYKKITQIDFFKAPSNIQNAAQKIDLSSIIKESSDYIAAALNPNAPADNRIALAITKLQHEKISSGGSATFEEEYLKTIGNIGVKAAKSNVIREHSKGILSQVKTMKERISGVSLDEEAANLVKFQHQYQANAKVIQSSERMFEAVLGIMR